MEDRAAILQSENRLGKLGHYYTGSTTQLEFHMRTCHKVIGEKQKVEDTRQDTNEEPESDTDYSDVEFISDHEASLDDHMAVSSTMKKPDDNVDSKFQGTLDDKYFDSGAAYISTPTTSIHRSIRNMTCGYNFVKNEDRQRILETGEKCYQCSYCPRSFQTFSSLCKHDVVHRRELGEINFQCSFCPYQSSIRSSMKKHIKRKH